MLPAIKLPPIPGLKKRIFGFDFSGNERLAWGLDQTVTGPGCTQLNSGHGSETISWQTKTEARVGFFTARGHGQFRPLSPGVVQTTSLRSSTLITNGCGIHTGAPVSDCNKPVAGTAGMRLSYDDRKGEINLNLGPINNPFSGGATFNCPFLFNVGFGPQDLVAVDPKTQRPLFAPDDGIAALLRLKRGEKLGQVLPGTWQLPQNELYCTEQAPGITCNSDAKSVYDVVVERIK